MRCNICDKALSDAEVVFNKDIDNYEPCSICLEAAMDAAFSQGFHRPDGSELAVEVGDEFGDGIVETLDTDIGVSLVSWGDAGDIVEEYDYD